MLSRGNGGRCYREDDAVYRIRHIVRGTATGSKLALGLTKKAKNNPGRTDRYEGTDGITSKIYSSRTKKHEVSNFKGTKP